MSYQYKVGGETVQLDIDPTVVAVRFKPGPMSLRAGATAAAQVGSFSQRFEVPGEELTLVPTALAPQATTLDASVAQNAMAALNANDDVQNALPVFRVAGNQVITTDRVIVGLDGSKAIAAVKATGFEVLSAEPDRMVLRIPE